MGAEPDEKDISGDEAFGRSITWAEEDRHQITSVPWDGKTFRWFRSPNVVCFEKYQRAA